MDVAAGNLPSDTREGSADRDDGVKRAVPTPARRAREKVAANPSTATISPKATARRASAAIMHCRRDQRSDAAPKIGPRNIAGRSSASKTRLIAHGEWKRS